jgi:hypothetical protein
MNPSQPRSLRVTLAEHGPGGARAGGDAPPLLQVTVGAPGPELLRLRPPPRGLEFEPFLRKISRKMAEPRGHRGGPDPLLKNKKIIKKIFFRYEFYLESV